jgi:hypothetical protein
MARRQQNEVTRSEQTWEIPMGLLSIRRIGLAGAVGMMLLMVGCATTRIAVVGPPGTVLTVDDKPYHLPATIEVTRPVGAGGSTRHKVSVVATVQSKELRAKGNLDAFGFNESDTDKLAVNTCNLDETQLARIFDGTVVIFRGQSASRQPLYDLTLRKD